MSQVKRNVLANYLGQGWVALMGFVFVPQYIKYLGMESYGLIGVFALLQAWLSLLNLGLTPTLTREMARFTAGAHTPQSIRELFHSLSLVVWSLALLIFFGVWLSAHWLAVSWLHAERLPVAAVARAISVMGIVIALKFVEGLYQGGIIGLQRQVWLNAVSAFLGTLRGAGAVLVLAFVAPTLDAFFLWQGGISLLTVVSYLVAIRRWLPVAPGPVRFSRPALAQVKGFAAGMLLTSLLSLLLLSVDKVILTRLLSLESFGRYSLASAVAGVIYQFVTPINQAFYPLFTELATCGDLPALGRVYHRGAQVVTVTIAPSVLLLAVFGREILFAWTGNSTLSGQVAPLIFLLVIGNGLHSLMYVPYSLQLAYGWTSLANWVNGIAVLLLVPAVLLAVPAYGAMASAFIWVCLTSCYVLFGAQIMYRRLLPKEKWHWYLNDLLLPIAGSLLVTTASKWLHPAGLGKIGEVAWLAVTWICALATSSLLSPDVRTLLRGAAAAGMAGRKLQARADLG